MQKNISANKYILYTKEKTIIILHSFREFHIFIFEYYKKEIK